MVWSMVILAYNSTIYLKDYFSLDWIILAPMLKSTSHRQMGFTTNCQFFFHLSIRMHIMVCLIVSHRSLRLYWLFILCFFLFLRLDNSSRSTFNLLSFSACTDMFLSLYEIFISVVVLSKYKIPIWFLLMNVINWYLLIWEIVLIFSFISVDIFLFVCLACWAYLKQLF